MIDFRYYMIDMIYRLIYYTECRHDAKLRVPLAVNGAEVCLAAALGLGLLSSEDCRLLLNIRNELLLCIFKYFSICIIVCDCLFLFSMSSTYVYVHRRKNPMQICHDT